MKHFLLTALFGCFLTVSFAQKTKNFTVCKGQLFEVFGKVSYKDNIQVDTTYHVIGLDSRYTQLRQYISLYDAPQLKEVHLFFAYCGEFLKKEEVGVSDTYMGNSITVGRLMGMKHINIYGIKGDERAYTQFALIQVKTVLSGIEYFAKNHKISLK